MARIPILTKKLDATQHKFIVFSNSKQVAEFKTLRTPVNPSPKQKIVLQQVKILNTDFSLWIKEAASKSSRKNLVIQELNTAGKLLSAYRATDCWVSEFSSLPELDAGADAVVIESLAIETEGWERDDNPP
jgi:phage tail-like protein